MHPRFLPARSTHTRSTHRRALLGSVAALGVLAAALPSLAQTTPAPAPAPAAPAAAAPTVIDMKLGEWTMGMSAMKARGAVQFNIENVGQFPHALKIEAKIGDQEIEISSARLAKGEKTTLTVKLPPGTYIVDCPVGNHEERGMKAELIIE